MPLEDVLAMVSRAAAGGYALGYFESWNLESLGGVLDAAEQTGSPTIVGFNGAFLSDPGRKSEERISWYAALGKAAAESAKVPCGLLFNECPDDSQVRSAIAFGFNLVMPADPAATLEEYTRRVARLTELAHARGVAVEAELGELPAGSPGHGSAAGAATDPDQAARFVEATGVDLLAVSVGNVHVKLDGTRTLDLALLEKIRERTNAPLVLHGGTGIDPDSLREAIALGVAKVNFGTYLKQRYLRAVRVHLDRDCDDPHRRLGMGGEDDVMVAGRRAVREAVLERIGLLGCCGQAPAPDSEGP
ncbi:class II fructose-bisphosphate aldolase [Paludisphaera mucosa]|uniref:Class II fructose-bisphosphate aldolase n=1 Tax=Paludisphaera mucosa TaxID=3030827 RepID=A0ABT6FJP4_9BACT|nr:class II fructose-bisphosphate aldolase [Paludisphaera mucosa]MDG3007721.1 class II fructose-bisphosphate aldolase [Paludisphaera mucosa]